MIEQPTRQASPLLGASLMAAAAMFGTTEMARAQAPVKTITNDQVTFTKDVAPILQRSCQKYHRPENIAPMSS
jgi:hypothetical protein